MNYKNIKLTALINGLSLAQIPLLAFAMPQVYELSETRSVIRIGLGWRTRNHLGVMYFGALAMGAELSIALKAVELIQFQKLKIDFIFKEFHSQFLRRANGDVHFICEDVQRVAQLTERTTTLRTRQEETLEGYAIVPKNSLEPIMRYKLTLSMKVRETL